jgi:hypothetical protein
MSSRKRKVSNEDNTSTDEADSQERDALYVVLQTLLLLQKLNEMNDLIFTFRSFLDGNKKREVQNDVVLTPEKLWSSDDINEWRRCVDEFMKVSFIFLGI